MLTCPRPLQPGVGHRSTVSCIARTVQPTTKQSAFHKLMHHHHHHHHHLHACTTKEVFTTAIRPPFDSHSTALRPLDDLGYRVSNLMQQEAQLMLTTRSTLTRPCRISDGLTAHTLPKLLNIQIFNSFALT